MSDLKQRILDLAKGLQLMNVATVTPGGKPRVRYVVGRADASLNLRFSTHLDSKKVQELKSNPNVFVTLGASDTRSEKWLQVEGTAHLSTEESERRAFWFEGLKMHFSAVDDPNYCVVIVRPTSIELGAMEAEPGAGERPSKASSFWRPEAPLALTDSALTDSAGPGVEQVRALYAALAARDLPAAQRLLTPDPVWDIAPGAPDAGVYRGMAEVFGNFYRRLGARFCSFRVHPERFVSDGARVVAVGDYQVVEREGDPPKAVRFAHVFGIAPDGRIAGVWQVADTARFG